MSERKKTTQRKGAVRNRKKRRLFFLRLPKSVGDAFDSIAEFHQQLTVTVQNKYGGRGRTNNKAKPEHRPYLLLPPAPEGHLLRTAVNQAGALLVSCRKVVTVSRKAAG